VANYGERVWANAVSLGQANAETLELARRHCLHMTFTECGGRGEAEASTGLPINMRQVSCLVALGAASANLDWIATDFYNEHCIGCLHRHPTGEIPNLASVVEARTAGAASAAEAEQTATAERHRGWDERVDRRRALVATSDTAMAGAIDDIGVLDAEPGTESDHDVRRLALGRLNALAERGADTFSNDAVKLAVELVESADVTGLLAPLRTLARARAEFGSQVIQAAVATLRTGPVVEAGRCLADLAPHVVRASMDVTVVRSLVILAGTERRLPGRRRNGSLGDASGLRVGADIAPRTVIAVLEAMLPAPSSPSLLILPHGQTAASGPGPIGDSDRSAAADAVHALAGTHPEIAARLAPSLVRNLGMDDGDPYEGHAVATVQRCLAAMLIWDVGDVPSLLEQAGRASGGELRDRLFGVVERATHLIDPGDRWREPGDPRPGEDRRHALFNDLVRTCLVRVGGDWGDDSRFSAAKAAAQMAQMQPGWATTHLSAFLGAFLTTVDDLEDKPPSGLLTPGSTSPQLQALQGFSRRNAVHSTARELLSAVEHVASADPAGVCRAVSDVIIEQRDSDRGPEVVGRILPLLGRIGRRYGTKPSLLRAILPTLHTYLLDQDAVLRSAALNAWVEIGVEHQLPSSVVDLLPALLADTYVVVIRAILGAARRLEWSDQDRATLWMYAHNVCQYLNAKDHSETLKDAMSALSALSRSDLALRERAEHLIVKRAAELDGYDLRDAIRRDWLPTTTHTPEMAALRLRQARDPQVNDRFNASDDEELCALLECAAGLTSIPTADLTACALDLAPDHPIGSAEFVEVAWRAGRPGDARTAMVAVVDATPNTPAYADHRSLADAITAAAALNMAGATGSDLADPAREVARTVNALPVNTDVRSDLGKQIRARATARLALAAIDSPPGLIETPDDPTGTALADPATAARARASILAAVGSQIAELSVRATPTAAYMRSYAGLCDIAAHLMRLDAAELEADTAGAAGHLTAARRRAEHLLTHIRDKFAPDDPIAGPLAEAFAAIRNLSTGSDAQAALNDWARLPTPLLVVQGPRRTRVGPPTSATLTPDPDEYPAAVVLASIDDRLVTGPQVLRRGQVYELRLDVRPGPWPDWAVSLDAELLTHLSASEVELPTFSWSRPADDSPLTGNGTLLLRFSLGAGRPAPPFLIALRWRGASDGQPASQAVDVAGHRELRLRPFDASRDYLTDFPVFDERLLTLYESLHRARYDEAQLQAFCRLFTAICRIGLRMTWNKKYKHGTRVTEKVFHDDLYAQLLAEPELGGRLDRGSPLALGFLDVRHDGITAELKVERTTAVNIASAPKYIGQPTQYAAADGARLSILCILDLSRKTSPVGVPENYMFTLDPAHHGLTNPEAPSLVSVIVVNGNLPIPSSWSRRKAPLRSDNPPVIS
jgi:hypothetical protein